MKMADRISVVEYLAETKEDFSSPTTSTFTSKMSLCRSTIASLEESLDADRAVLKKLKSSVKALYTSGIAHTSNEAVFIECLEKLGAQSMNSTNDSDPAIGPAFLKFAVFTKELSSLLKNLITIFNSLIVVPLESFLKTELKGVRGDMKRPFDKSWKDYDTKVKQVEREKRQLAKDAGMIRNEISGAEIAEEMEKERRMFQLQMCEYLIKVNEIKTKKGADMLQHLVEYYQSQNTYFTDGCKAFEQFKSYATDLTADLHSVRQAQDEEKRQLMELKNVLKSVTDNDGQKNPSVYNLHQLQGLKEYGNERTGHLMKRSEGLRKAWQKRQCKVKDGFLTISHNNMSKPPVKLNLLTSQVKLVPEDKKQFDLVSHNRTYRFMTDDEIETNVWVSVITNSKEDALNRVFGEGENSEQNSGVKELTRSILDEIKLLPGNDSCCDCGKADPKWLSTNLGVLLCIECSGIHRDMGVHISRIQSITLDKLGTSELLLARSMGNTTFNKVMEGKLKNIDKPSPDSDMEVRKSFIRAKYEGRVYVQHVSNDDTVLLGQNLQHAVLTSDISLLLQVFAEGGDLSMSIPNVDGEDATALHLAVLQETKGLHLVDFIVQNSANQVNQQSSITHNTALHMCAEYTKTECMKLLLRGRAKTDIMNTHGETALDIARRKDSPSCEDLLLQSMNGKFPQTVHVDFDWNLSFAEEEFGVDLSDDEMDSMNTAVSNLSLVNSPMTNTPRGRPASAVLNPNMSSTPSEISRQRTTSYKTRDKPTASPLPPPRPEKPFELMSRRTNSDTSRINYSASMKQPAVKVLPASPLQHRSSEKRSTTTPSIGKIIPPTPDKRDSFNVSDHNPHKPAKKFFRKKYTQLKGKTRPRAFQHVPDEEVDDSPPVLPAKSNQSNTPPAPLPRGSGSMNHRPTRVKAIYDCQADNEDELTFVEDEIIVVTGVEDNEWWMGHVEHQPHRTGVFPISFVMKLAD